MTRILAAFAAFGAVLSLLLWVAAGALSAAAERSVTYKYIADALAPAETLPETVEWDEGEPSRDVGSRKMLRRRYEDLAAHDEGHLVAQGRYGHLRRAVRLH